MALPLMLFGDPDTSWPDQGPSGTAYLTTVTMMSVSYPANPRCRSRIERLPSLRFPIRRFREGAAEQAIG
jgi:hypothetical protein